MNADLFKHMVAWLPAIDALAVRRCCKDWARWTFDNVSVTSYGPGCLRRFERIADMRSARSVSRARRDCPLSRRVFDRLYLVHSITPLFNNGGMHLWNRMLLAHMHPALAAMGVHDAVHSSTIAWAFHKHAEAIGRYMSRCDKLYVEFPPAPAMVAKCRFLQIDYRMDLKDALALKDCTNPCIAFVRVDAAEVFDALAHLFILENLTIVTRTKDISWLRDTRPLARKGIVLIVEHRQSEEAIRRLLGHWPELKTVTVRQRGRVRRVALEAV